MIFKSICLAAAFSAAPTEAVVSSSSNSTKLNNDTYEPKGRVGAPRRDLGSGTKSAFVLLKRGDANGLGHVAGCFEEENGYFVCFSTDNPDGDLVQIEGYVYDMVSSNGVPFSFCDKWEGKGFWIETKAKQDEVLDLFKGKGYTDWKRLDVYDSDPDRATSRMKTVACMPYNIVNRNCQNDVYDVLHDEGLGFGTTANSKSRNNGCYIGWVQFPPAPNNWFDHSVAATASGVWKSDERGDDQCWGNKYCASGLTCCGGKCKKKVNKRWCVFGWWSWTCFDNWTCP